MDFVKLAREDNGVAVVTIDRQEKLNALNPQVVEEIGQTLLELETESPRAIIVTGAGEKSFVAGADIASMSEMSALEAKRFAELGHAAMALLDRSPVPTIAAVGGFAFGGGLEIALACDIRVASENALMGFPEVGLGILPGMGGTQRAPRLLGPAVAKELIFTGRRIKAEEAMRIGLVNRVVGQGEALSAAKEIAAEIAANGPLAVRFAKACANRAHDVDLVSGLEYEADQFALLFSTEDAREGMGAFVEKRKAEFRGA
ncbi:Enoyl-CoA hydratase/carnithine racemase [Rubrobacter radiotolerans]|uniref:enoyl-CoA hydratase n=1 Tax=Rubrobacter radiotolerans TaxID=42256 RepID=A0A023X4E2_RUBRA|nr:enoyl-CoA hydratase-related protein [Rubrobacter radiotolerans]AHY47342.1 Enoyl-CoA hydratase/carnithine racemase [Rubrobacter radiotolerans]MDX5894746.1 enoyl-CoA hydratase-related protein [Rubrobacter radiotolerans]SMC06673.1 short chain enoyl-CoA hydratase [Rubrobacter radiotolerans DSM 5868]